MGNLFEIIGPICLSPDKEDHLVWEFSKDGMFSVKSCKEAKWSGMLSGVGWNLLWKLKIPSKVAFFLWT